MKKFFSRLVRIFNPWSLISAGLGLLAYWLWGDITEIQITKLLGDSDTATKFITLPLFIPTWSWPIFGFISGHLIKKIANITQTLLGSLSPYHMKHLVSHNKLSLAKIENISSRNFRDNLFIIFASSLIWFLAGVAGLFGIIVAQISNLLFIPTLWASFKEAKRPILTIFYYFFASIFTTLIYAAPTLAGPLLVILSSVMLVFFKSFFREPLSEGYQEKMINIIKSSFTPIELAVQELTNKKNKLTEYKNKIVGQDTIFGELINDADKQLVEYDKVIRYYNGLEEKDDTEQAIFDKASEGKKMIESYKQALDSRRKRTLEFLNQVEVGIEQEIKDTLSLVDREKANLENIEILKQLGTAVDDLNLKTKDYLESKLLGALKALDGFMDTVRDKNIIEEARRIIAGEMEIKLQLPEPNIDSSLQQLAINTDIAMKVIDGKLKEINDLMSTN